ncbi:MAG: hypothetical protein LBD91_02555 [Prevotellaceae bacterium]|nr:hypothetical protein [Prevotellaceae bacterium]
MKFFTKIVFFIFFLLGCVSSRYGGVMSREVYRVNHRAELQRLQRERQARSRREKEADEKATKEEKQEAKALEQAQKMGAKRHLEWQSPETRERIKANKKESEKKFKN